LNECERGEDAAKSAYKEASEQSFPSYILDTIQTQYASVKQAHDRIKALRDASNNATTDTSSNTAGSGY
jgi:uncharacterized protein (TIGR02284 family)